MKTQMLLGLALSASLNAFAVPSVCTNGQIGSDAYMQVKFGKKNIEITQHETSFAIPLAVVKRTGNVSTVTNRTVRLSAEGEEALVNIDARLVYDKVRNTLNVSYSLEGFGEVQGEKLKCR